MASCGMYDGAGEWFVGVGLPAKSGVSGGILAVLPGQLGIAVCSPPVDARGNSVRGIAVCRDLSSAMDLHTFTAALSQGAPIRAHSTLATRRSKRIRSPRPGPDCLRWGGHARHRAAGRRRIRGRGNGHARDRAAARC